MNLRHKVGVIGGTGMENAPLFKDFRLRTVITKYGIVKFKQGHVNGRQVLFLLRHGPDYKAPHRINARANIWALKQEGIGRIIATAACGSLRRDIRPGDLALLSDFIDFTRGRIEVFEPAGRPDYLDLSAPYDRELNRSVRDAAKKLKLRIKSDLVYACTEGPRFETRAEIRAYRALGADVVGMTQVPEVVLAAEAGIPYSAIAVVTNYAAGLQKKVSGREVSVLMKKKAGDISRILSRVI